MSVVQGLKAARDRMALHGMCRSRFINQDKQVCIMGALAVVAFGEEFDSNNGPYIKLREFGNFDGNPKLAPMMDRLFPFLPEKYQQRGYGKHDGLATWNNEAAKDTAEVLALFDKAIIMAIAAEDAQVPQLEVA